MYTAVPINIINYNTMEHLHYVYEFWVVPLCAAIKVFNFHTRYIVSTSEISRDLVVIVSLQV